MLRNLAVLLLFLHISTLLAGQEIYSAGREGSWKFSYLPQSPNRYTNQIINQMALANRKIPEKTSFSFHFSYRISLAYDRDAGLNITLRLTPAAATGDVRVSHFDVSDILVPGNATFYCAVQHPLDGERFRSAESAFSLDTLIRGAYVASIPDSLWREGSSIVVVFTSFGFDQHSYSRAERELYYIRDYEAAGALADTLDQRLRKARTSRHEIPEAFALAVTSRKMLNLLGEASRWRSAIVPGSDPLNLARRRDIAEYKTNELLTYLLDKGINPSLTGNGYKRTAEAFGDAIRDALSLSQKVDYYSSPFFYRLYSNGISAAEMASMKKYVDGFMRKEGFADWDVSLLSREISGEYLKLAGELMAADRYVEAIDLLVAAGRFAGANPFSMVPDTLPMRLIEARNGLTSSYVRVVKKALKNNLTVIAENYLAEAGQYAGKYGIAGMDDNGLPALYQEVVDLHVGNAIASLSKNNYRSALGSLEKAWSLALQYPGIKTGHAYSSALQRAAGGVFKQSLTQVEGHLKNRDFRLAEPALDRALAFASQYENFQPDLTAVDSLRKQIAGLKYQDLLEQARLEKLNHNRIKAVEILQEAALLERTASLETSVLFDTLVSVCALPVINDLYSQGRLKLWAGEPLEAIQLSDSAYLISYNLGISHLTSLREQRRNLDLMADEMLCSRVKGELESMIERVDALFAANQYSQASALVMQTRELIYSRSYCGLTTRELNRVLDAYRIPVRWNDLHARALGLIASGDYTEGIALLQESEALFSHYRLDTLGLAGSGLFEIAYESGNASLLTYASGYYIARQKPDHALALLEKLRLSGAGETETSGLQESLARELAARDLREAGSINVKDMIRIYTGNSKWYRRFSDVYRFHAAQP